MTSLLRFEAVTLVRGGRALFEDLDLELGSGDGLQIIGPNGAGKSSLIRLAAGLLAAERGRIERASFALADDSIALDRDLPLKRALSFWSPSPEPSMEAMGITPLSDVPVRLLSSGQLKRSTLSRVGASGARLWLLDEPLNALDSPGTALLGEMLARHRSSGGAILAASHLPLPGEWRTLEVGQ